jgi:hypothetical protein
MRFIYVLENEPRFQKEIVEAILSIDPKLQVRLFPKLEGFTEWLRFMMGTGPAAIASGGLIPPFGTQDPVSETEEHQLVAVVSKVEYLGANQLELLKKTRDLLIQRKICTAEDPTAFVLTAFENKEFNLRALENQIITNVIFKPFDRLILAQDLTFAIDGRHPPSKYTIANQKTTTMVEMLKNAQLEALSDVGLVTRSQREIPIGSVSKYYGKNFISDRHRSVFAICQDCIPHPQSPTEFLCTMRFFGADQTQVTRFRKMTRDKDKTSFAIDWRKLKAASPAKDIQIIFLDEEEMGPSGLGPNLEKRFNGIKIISYSSFAAFLTDLSPDKALGERDPQLKTLGGANTVTLMFDSAGSIYLGFESDRKDVNSFFGVPEASLKNKSNWFINSLSQEHKEKFRKYAKTVALDTDNVLRVQMGDTNFIVKVMEVKKDGDKLKLVLTEPSKIEQIAWLQANSKVSKPIHLIVAGHQFFGEGAKERWNFAMEALKAKYGEAPKLIMTSKKDFSDTQEREMAGWIYDIFFKPVDPVYFFQKIKILFPFLLEREKTAIQNIELKENIKVANPVTITEFSEAGCVMKYHRAIGIGSFREIVLYQPYEITAPELYANCNFVEPTEGEKDMFNCHFVFFGITDHFLKAIRLWIRNNYIQSKEGQG